MTKQPSVPPALPVMAICSDRPRRGAVAAEVALVQRRFRRAGGRRRRLVRLGLAEGDDVRRQPLDLLRHEPALGHGVGRELLVDEDLEHQLACGPPGALPPAETYAVDAGQAQEPLRGPLLAGAELVVGQVARHVIVGHLPTPTGPPPRARPHSSHTAPEGLPCQRSRGITVSTPAIFPCSSPQAGSSPHRAGRSRRRDGTAPG